MLSLHDSLSMLFSDPEIFKFILEKNSDFKNKYLEIKSGKREKINLNEESEILDVADSLVISELINKGYFNLEDIGLTFMMFIDEIEVWKKSKNKNICMILLCLNELPPHLRFKERCIIPLGAFQTRGKLNSSILCPFTTQLQIAFFNPKKLYFNHYKPINNGTKIESYSPNVKCMILGIIIG